MSLRAISVPSSVLRLMRDAELAGVVVVEVAADVVAGLVTAASGTPQPCRRSRARLHRERPRCAAVECASDSTRTTVAPKRAEVLRADRPGAEPREVGDLDPVEWHASSFSSSFNAETHALPRAASSTFVRRHAELAEHLGVVLARQRRPPAQRPRRRRQPVRRAGVAHRRAQIVVLDVLVPLAALRAAGSSPDPPASRRCRSSAAASAPPRTCPLAHAGAEAREHVVHVRQHLDARRQLLRLAHEAREERAGSGPAPSRGSALRSGPRPCPRAFIQSSIIVHGAPPGVPRYAKIWPSFALKMPMPGRSIGMTPRAPVRVAIALRHVARQHRASPG